MILMAKAGIGAQAVAAMPHAELAAWFDDILLSLGVPPQNEGVIVSKRLKRPQSSGDNHETHD